jgi:hypothetical protein
MDNDSIDEDGIDEQVRRFLENPDMIIFTEVMEHRTIRP